jgi:hypothetical protein
MIGISSSNILWNLHQLPNFNSMEDEDQVIAMTEDQKDGNDDDDRGGKPKARLVDQIAATCIEPWDRDKTRQ